MASVIGSMHYLKDDPAEEQWRGVDLPATQQSLLTVSNKTVVALFTPMADGQHLQLQRVPDLSKS